MDKRYYILIIIIWICNTGVGQDFSFRWEVHPSLAGKVYIVKIEKKAHKGYITGKEGGRKDSILKKMNPDDCDLYSSARFYAGLNCVLEVMNIGLPWRTV